MSALANAKHEAFCQEFLVDLNATAAYQRAYPDASRPSARAAAAVLIAHLSVSDRIAELQVERAARVQVRQDDVLREILLLAFSDVRYFTVDDLGHLNLLEGAPDSAWRAVASVKHRITTRGDDAEFTVREIEYRLWNKPEALKMLLAHLGDAAGREDEDVIPLATLRRAIQRASLRAG